MEDKDDEKDSRKNKTNKTTRPPVSFVWGSPLHKMVDPTETDPYDIVEYSDVSHDTNNQVTNLRIFVRNLFKIRILSFWYITHHISLLPLPSHEL